jgi:hypothetical protein
VMMKLKIACIYFLSVTIAYFVGKDLASWTTLCTVAELGVNPWGGRVC